MSVRITKAATAEVAHYLEDHPGEKNRRIHGHSLRIAVTAEGQPHGGMVHDFGAFGARVSEVANAIDHTCLNDHFPEIDPPTLENIAIWFAGQMMAIDGLPRIISVKVERPTCGESAEWLQ